MCGICGKLNFDRESRVSPTLLKAMADSIQHRGPDDEGFYFSGQVGLGFRRLSIIDLAGGHQPLSNEDESVWIVFNGEIYNYKELRQFLVAKGHRFRTQSDTEVIVHLYEEFGEACVEKLAWNVCFCDLGRSQQILVSRPRPRRDQAPLLLVVRQLVSFGFGNKGDSCRSGGDARSQSGHDRSAI